MKRQRGLAIGQGLVLGVLFPLMLGGCLGFEYDWRVAESAPASPGSLAGRWSGRWTSDATGNQGKLRCIVTDMKEGKFEARFHAVHLFVIPREFRIAFESTTYGGLWHFAGDNDLGWLAGGPHRYNGKASNNRFFVTYQSADDRGVWDLVRVEASAKDETKKASGGKWW